MIKRFGLPDSPLPAQPLIDLVRGSAFDRTHDLSERTNFHGILVDQGREDEVHMIRHDNSNTKIKLDSVVMQAAFQHDGTYPLWKKPPMLGTKCYKLLFVIALQVRKLPTIKGLQHRFGSCGD